MTKEETVKQLDASRNDLYYISNQLKQKHFWNAYRELGRLRHRLFFLEEYCAKHSIRAARSWGFIVVKQKDGYDIFT